MKNNKLIAEFMGMEFGDDGTMCYDDAENRHPPTPTDMLAFHTSWDWLMPVVEEIESDERYDVEILQYGTRILDNQKEIVNNIANISFDKKINHTYQAVVEFIKNQNK